MLFWGCLAIILFIIDAITTGALLLGFSISAFITATITLVAPLWVQVLFFLVLGILLTLVILPKIKKSPEVKSYGDTLEGLILKSCDDMIEGEVYQAKVKGTFWNIKAIENINKNQNMKIIKVDKENNCLIVKGE